MNTFTTTVLLLLVLYNMNTITTTAGTVVQIQTIVSTTVLLLLQTISSGNTRSTVLYFNALSGTVTLGHQRCQSANTVRSANTLVYFKVEAVPLGHQR